MNCASCGQLNPLEARFCNACGSAIAARCSKCNAENPAGARFCNGCGSAIGLGIAPATKAAGDPRAYTPKHLADKILQSRSALEGERKQVTVLFADVKGSMELAEQLDPEEWHKILERFFEILAEGVHRFEGTVNQYTGDGIMALFGAPIAHEDHAQRACYAALQLRDELRRFAQALRRERGLDVATRIGINSGEVVVGRIGDDLRMDYTAQGHTVGLAQRMEALAEAGKIYLTAATAQTIEGYFALEDLGEFNVKGAAAPVHAYSLEGLGPLRTRFDRSRARGLSKFAGRATEMSALEAALEQALTGHGQVVGIVADAGTGKSRLCYEFIEVCRAKGIRVHTTTGVAHGKAVPLLPVLEFYRSTFGIAPQDDAHTARQKIAGSVVQGDESLIAALPLIFDFLGVPDPDKPVLDEPGPQRQRALLAVLKRLTLARSRREPAVILFEDLHWIDEATGVFLENLVDATDGSRTLLVANFRPEYRADWMHRSYCQQLALSPLDPRAFSEMLGETLGADPSLGDLVSRIHARSGGNPFFAEEIVQSLIESNALTGGPGAYRLTRDAVALEIPDTVQLVLAARMDRLSERGKNVLQTAAVIGRDFGLVLLRNVAGLEADVLDETLRALVRGEFLHETAIYPEAEYQFKHPLTQEAALGSQLRERRARTHAAVAAALIALHPNGVDEQAALLAHHYELAGDAAEAIRWHERAAAWLEGRDPQAGYRHWVTVLALVQDDGASVEQMRGALRACGRVIALGVGGAGIDFARGEALYQRGRELAALVDEPALLAGVVSGFGLVASFNGEMAAALAAAEAAFALAPRVDDPRQLAELVAHAAAAICNAGRCREALTAIDGVLASGRITSNTPVPLAQLLSARGHALIRLGRLAEARAALDRADALLPEGREVQQVVLIEMHRAEEFEARGFPDGALEQAVRRVAVADAAEMHGHRHASRATLALAYVACGRADEAMQFIEEADSISREGSLTPTQEGVITRARARALLALGEIESACALVEPLAAGAKRVPPFYAGRQLLQIAAVLIAADATGERARIEAALREAAEITELVKSPETLAAVCVQRAHLARAVGDEDAWRRELREALRIYTEMDATGWMERVGQELAS